MRWLQIHCVLMAGFAILSATNAEGPRDKRDLKLIKNLIKSAIFGSDNKTTPAPILINNEENVRIFRIPGIDNVLIKAIPKVPVAVADPGIIKVLPVSVTKQQKASIVASYLGTQSEAETLKALQGVKALVSSGVLTAKKEVVAPLLPNLQLVNVVDNKVERPHILFDTTTICDDVPVNDRPVVIQEPTFWQHQPLLSIFHRPIQFPSVLKPVKPVEIPVPVLPTKYSYKQIHGDGRVTTYTSNDNRNVIVTESDRPAPLPPFVTYRIQEAMKLGAQGIQHMPTIPVVQGHIRQPMVQYFESPKVNFYPPTYSSNYFYKQINKDGTATSYSTDLKEDNVVVTQTGKVPTLPEFVTDRIEKVAATAVTGKRPNIDVLAGPHVGQSYLYNQPNNDYPKIDIRGGVQVKVDSKDQQKMNVASKGSYSYQTVHKDGTVTNHLNEASVFKNPVGNIIVKPITPAGIENRLESIAQTSGGSFSYKILHNDGSVTNYGVFGVHEGVNGENKILPLEKKTPIFQASTPQLNKKGSAGLFTYKTIHNDGSVSSYSSAGVVEEKGPSFPTSSNIGNEKNQILNENQGTTQVSDLNSNRATTHVIRQGTIEPQNVNPSVGSFSYKAIHNDGSMTIYSQNGVSEITGSQKESVAQYKNLNAVSDKKEDVQSAKQNVQVINGAMVSNKQVNEKSIASPVSGSFSYKTVHNDGSTTIHSQNGVKDVQTDFKDKQKNQQPLSITDKVKGSVSTKKNMNFEDTKLHTNPIDDSKLNYEYTSITEVIPAAPELPEISNNALTDSPASILVADSNKLLLTKPIVSSYSYKQINHNQPDQFTVAVNIDDGASKESLKVSGQVAVNSQTNKDATADPVLNDYVYILPASTNESPSVGPLVPIEEIHIGTLNPPSALVLAPVEDVTCVEKLSEHPIVVLDEPMSYSYEHRKVDGSAMIVESDQNVVSVTISPKKDNAKRGDIP